MEGKVASRRNSVFKTKNKNPAYDAGFFVSIERLIPAEDFGTVRSRRAKAAVVPANLRSGRSVVGAGSEWSVQLFCCLLDHLLFCCRWPACPFSFLCLLLRHREAPSVWGEEGTNLAL